MPWICKTMFSKGVFMKNMFLALLVSLVFSPIAQADEAPSVNPGDYAVYDRTDSANPQPSTLSWEVLQLQSTRVAMQEVLESQGSSSTSMFFEPLSTFQKNSEILAHCKENNGVEETIQVPAGTYPTCKISYEEGDYKRTRWIGKVPVYGYVQSIRVSKIDGATVTTKLKRNSQ
jgi:hypothetical protein